MSTPPACHICHPPRSPNRAPTVEAELARVSAERDAAVKERDTWMARADEWGKIVGELNQKFLTLEQERDAALAKVRALEAVNVRLQELVEVVEDVLYDGGVGTLTENGKGIVEYLCGQCERNQKTGDHEEGCNWWLLAAALLPDAALASEVPPQPTTRVALTTPTDEKQLSEKVGSATEFEATCSTCGQTYGEHFVSTCPDDVGEPNTKGLRFTATPTDKEKTR